MELVKKGEVWWAFTCENCQSVWNVDIEDVICYKGEDETRYYVECLHCGKIRFVPDSKLTLKIENLARKKGRA